MFPLIPYKRISLIASHTTEEAAAVLAPSVSRRSRWFPLLIGRKDGWEGYVTERGFNINRMIKYRNPLLPILHGRFYLKPNGSEVKVRMLPHAVVLALLIFWYALLLATFIQLAIEWRNGRELTGNDLIPFGILLFSYIVCYFSFGIEAQIATQFIYSVFKQDSSSTTTESAHQ